MLAVADPLFNNLFHADAVESDVFLANNLTTARSLGDLFDFG